MELIQIDRIMDVDTRLGFSVDEAAQATSTSRQTIYRAIKSKQLKARKIGRRTVILKTELERFLQQLRSFG